MNTDDAILIRCTKSMHNELKNLAHDKRKSLSAFLRDTLQELINKK